MNTHPAPAYEQHPQHPDETVAGDLSRREFAIDALKLIAGAAGVFALAACGGHEPSVPAPQSTEHASGHVDSTPNSDAEIKTLLDSPNAVVKGLGQLEETSRKRGMFGGVMQFLYVSTSDTKGPGGLAAELVQSSEAGLPPVTIFGLDGLFGSDGTKLDAIPSHEAGIREDLQLLFGILAKSNIDPRQLGPFVLCPEYVSGYQGDPTHYARDLNLFLRILEEVAPGTPASTMIDLNELDQLIDTFPAVNAHKLESVGIQAFANDIKIPFDKSGNPDVSVFISADKIGSIAKAFPGKPIWLNTGIIRRDANADVDTRYTHTQRLAMADAIADVIEEAVRNGADIKMVNLFAQNKLNGVQEAENAEKRDFSFHRGDEDILVAFYNRMNDLGIELSGYAVAGDNGR